MVLFTKVYGELSLRIQQSLPRCNNRGAFQAHAGARASRSRSPTKKKGMKVCQDSLGLNRFLTKVWNRALSKSCRDIKV